jgi:hypothetical protein
MKKTMKTIATAIALMIIFAGGGGTTPQMEGASGETETGAAGGETS